MTSAARAAGLAEEETVDLVRGAMNAAARPSRH